jgi:type I restriction enzyme R subunit
VASSIYEACKYFELFQKTVFKGKCAVVTSYNPQTKDATLEDTGANTETDKLYIYNTYTTLLKDKGMPNTEAYEDFAKKMFKEQPANMKLLVVVDKLLTGFDAPSCTFLYIDKSMQDHGLFQAICRTNRLDGDDKEFGYIVDYKDLFKKVEDAISVYTKELDRGDGGVDPQILLKERLSKGRERLDTALNTIGLLCEPVKPPQGELEHIHYFCGNTEIPEDLQNHEPQRVALYKATVALVRAYANIADELGRAGYSADEIKRIEQSLDRYLKLREIIRNASGESLDLKAYEADMRHLIDSYIKADEPRKISPFDDMPLLELIVKTGIANAINSRLGGLKGNHDAIAESIENNVRSKIIKEHLSDPAFYDKMSTLLDEIISARKAKAIEYEKYLRQIAEIVKQVDAGKGNDTPDSLKTPGQRALYNLLSHSVSGKPLGIAETMASYGDSAKAEALALSIRIDETVKQARPNGWRGVQAKENVIKAALFSVLKNIDEVERIFLVIRQQKEY